MKRLAIFAGVVVLGAVTFLMMRSSEHEPPPVAPAAPDAGTAAKKIVHREDRPLGIDGKPIEREASKRPQPQPEQAQQDPARADRERENREPEPGDDAALAGMDLMDVSSTELRELKVPEGVTGVVVRAVDPGSSAAEATLQKGDVIVRAQHDKITTMDSLRASVSGRSYTLLTVYRDGYPFQVVLHKPFRGDP